MAFRKIVVEIQGNTYDLWNLVSAEKEDDWNIRLCKMEYKIVLNKTAVARDFREVIFIFETREERDAELANIRKMLSKSPFILYANDVQEDEELVITKRKKGEPPTTSGVGEDDLEFD